MSAASPKTMDPMAEILPPLTEHEARVEAQHCLYCFDAPCVQACPTHIDIPGFIRKIGQDRPRDAAKTILSANLLGASCSRVCPVHELCEGACVMGENFQPIQIGRLQRYATDSILNDSAHKDRPPVFEPAKATGKKIAVVGSGPAGLSCGGELAKRGHSVDVFEKNDMAGGLSTYGIVTLREPVEVALAEVELIKKLGVRVHTDKELGRNLTWPELEGDYDAVFLGIGLGKVPKLGIPGDDKVVDGLEYVEACKIKPDSLTVGKKVVVVGAGNTAIDCATVAKRCGADDVTILYRRSADEMTAYPHEYEFAKNEGIVFKFLSQPLEVVFKNGKVAGLRCQVMQLGAVDESGRRQATPVPGEDFVIEADQIVAAIGQTKPAGTVVESQRIEKGYIAVDSNFRTAKVKVFAGGDAIRSSGAASTVMAVQDGKLAARAIHAFLGGK